MAIFLLGVSACAAGAPILERNIAWSADGVWMILDSHTHTQFSDGEFSVLDVAEFAEEQGCDALAITDHSSVDLQAAMPTYFEAVEAARKKFPQLVLFGGLEWNVPPYGGREHVMVLVNPHVEANVLSKFNELFQGEKNADEALRWLKTILPSVDDGVLFLNHPSRKDLDAAENLSDMRAWRDVNEFVVGFEGGPGHQNMEPVGAYVTQFKTVDRWDPVVDELGGTWDQLLDAGLDVWGALAVSDFHSDKSDYRPCEFARTHVEAPDRTATSLLKGLRAGSFWGDHGRILDRLELTVSVRGGPDQITPGGRMAITPDAIGHVRLHLSRGSGAIDAPLDVEIIGNCTAGTPGLIAVDRLQPSETSMEEYIAGFKLGADASSCYVRARVRKVLAGARDLMAYTNAIRLVIDETAAGSILPNGKSGPATTSQRTPGSSSRMTELIGAVIVILLVGTGALWLLTKSKPALTPSHGSPSTRVKPEVTPQDMSEDGSHESYSYHSMLLDTSLTIDEKTRTVVLKTGQSTSADLPYSRFRSCEVCINGDAVATASGELNTLTDEDLNDALEKLLALKSQPMHSGDERKIDLIINYEDPQSSAHIVNFYYRIGSHRMTHESLDDSSREVLGWLQYLEHEVFAPSERSRTDVRGSYADELQHENSERRSVTEELDKLVELKERDLLTDDEFRKAKSRLLDG